MQFFKYIFDDFVLQTSTSAETIFCDQRLAREDPKCDDPREGGDFFHLHFEVAHQLFLNCYVFASVEKLKLSD